MRCSYLAKRIGGGWISREVGRCQNLGLSLLIGKLSPASYDLLLKDMSYYADI